MLRVVKTPEDEYLLDETRKKNGRGAYLCVSSQCCEKAVRNKGVQRSFKEDIPKEVYEKLTKEIEIIEKR